MKIIALVKEVLNFITVRRFRKERFNSRTVSTTLALEPAIKIGMKFILVYLSNGSALRRIRINISSNQSHLLPPIQQPLFQCHMRTSHSDHTSMPLVPPHQHDPLRYRFLQEHDELHDRVPSMPPQLPQYLPFPNNSPGNLPEPHPHT